MPPSACPACESVSFKKLDASSEMASVKYYKCDNCGHVWTTVKGDSDTIGHVTELPEKDKG